MAESDVLDTVAHELWHAVQFHRLGTEKYMSVYAEELIAKGYSGHALELPAVKQASVVVRAWEARKKNTKAP